MSTMLAPSPSAEDLLVRRAGPRTYAARRRPLRSDQLSIAAEPTADYGAGAASASEPADDGAPASTSAFDLGAGVAASGQSGDLLDRLVTTVEAVGATDLIAMSDGDLGVHLQRLRRPIAALEAARARALAELERRASVAVGPERRSAEVQRTRRKAARDQRMTPSEAKRSAEAGRHAGRHPATGRAFDGGDIGATHVQLIGEALERLPEGDRGGAEQELLELAHSHDAIAFGRAVRDLLARRAPAAAHRDEHRRHRDRHFRMTDTADGGVAFSGLAYGIAAELARTALDAFRRPDTPDEHRTPDQRSADAFEQLCDAALRLGAAPTLHGERPQVILVIDEAQLGLEAGVAHFAGSGQPATLAEVGSLLTDCTVSRLAVAADGTPIEASRNVRTVPAGLWRALIVRDGGCRWQGCDAPASWCDVAHGEDPFHKGGRLSPANAVLLCRRHHRRFDHGAWRLEIHGDEVSFHRVVVPFVHPLDRDAAERAERARARAGPEPPTETAGATGTDPPRDPGSRGGSVDGPDDGDPDERILGPPEQLSISEPDPEP